MDYALPAEIDPLIESLSDAELCLLNVGAFGGQNAVSAIRVTLSGGAITVAMEDWTE